MKETHSAVAQCLQFPFLRLVGIESREDRPPAGRHLHPRTPSLSLSPEQEQAPSPSPAGRHLHPRIRLAGLIQRYVNNLTTREGWDWGFTAAGRVGLCHGCVWV